MSAATGTDVPGADLSLAWMEQAAPVDVFDATARLEASGIGDLKAIQSGFSGVFDQARKQFRTPAISEPVPVVAPQLMLSMWRAVALCAGMLICLSMLGSSIGPVQTFTAGAGCWIAAQITSSVLWWGINEGQPESSARVALNVLALAAAFSGGISATAMDPAVMGWVLWGWVAAVAICRVPVRMVALLCCAGAATAWLSRVVSGVGAGVTVGFCLVLCASAICVRMLFRDAVAEPGKFDGLGASIGWAAVCVLAQLASIALAYIELGEAFVALAVGAVVGNAVSESVLEVAGYLVRLAAAKLSSWAAARIVTTTIGMLCVLVLCIVNVAATLILAGLWNITTSDELIILALLISAIGSGVGFALRLGSATSAAVIAVSGALMTSIVVSGGLGSTSVVGGVAAFVAALLGSTRLASPRAW